MKLPKILLSLLLCFVMILGLVAVSGEGFAHVFDSFSVKASAASSGTCGDRVTWNLSDDGVLKISGTGEMYNFRYPDYSPWYSLRNSVNSVLIDSGVTTIGDYAFRNCEGLEEISIPNGIISVGMAAFETCFSLQGISLPDSVAEIGESAFESCTSLKSFSIPSSVSCISRNMFAYCSYLEEIDIPDSITTVEDYAFSNCAGLTDISLPGGVISIGHHAFLNCSGLTDISIPDSVTSLGDFAFGGCEVLKKIRLSASMTQIGNKVFYECWSLSNVSIPKSVTSIGDYAFAFCEDLTEVILPDSVKSIGDYAFGFCDSLESVHIPSGVTSIGASIFTGDNIEYPCAVCVCSDSEDCLAKEYAEEKGFKFRLCSGHSEEEIVPEPIHTHDAIINYSKYNETTQPYRSSITFRAITESGETTEWSVADAEYTVNEDGSCTVKEAKGDFSVTCVIKDSDGNIVCKATETIKIRHGFFDKLIAFFKGLLHLLPDFIQ